MRNMSFSMTTEQIRNRTKTVTRRMGWGFLKPEDVVMAVEKGQGLKKGEHVKKICPIRIVSIKSERLWQVPDEDVSREGFHGWTRSAFIGLLVKAMPGCRWQSYNRIEFEYVEAP